MSAPNGPTGNPTDDGASPKELLLEASRRNNTDLFIEVLSSIPSTADPAHFLNTSTDALGLTALHLAAQYGCYDMVEELLDQEGLEVDPVDRLDKETPLHKAVKYANTLDFDDREHGETIVELLLDAGADPRIGNKGRQRPIDLVDPSNKSLRNLLQEAEYVLDHAGDVVEPDYHDDNDHASVGSGSEEG